MDIFKNFIDTTITNVDERTKFIVEDEETHETRELCIRDLLVLNFFELKENNMLEESIADLKKVNRWLKNQNHDYECMLDGCVDGAEICKCAVCRDYFYAEDCTHKDEWGKPICDDCYDKAYKQ